MARIKIILSLLPWVEFSCSRVDSKLIKLPDYFSRTEIDITQYKNKIPNLCDVELCEKYDRKLSNKRAYSAPQSVFLMDSLLSVPETELDSILDRTYCLDQNGTLIFDRIKAD